MKLPVLSGFVVLCAATALAQTSTSAQPSPAVGGTMQATQPITVTGCVGGGTNSQPYMLNSAVVLPQTGAAAGGATSVDVAGAARATPAAMPPAGTASTASPPTAGAPTTGAATPPPGAVGGTATTGAAGTSGTVGTGSAGTAGIGAAGAAGTGATGGVGTAGATGATRTPTTPGAVAPAADMTSAGSSAMSGYRLSGTDMGSWAGQRVQIVGTVIPAGPGAASATPGTVPAPELRVQSVQSIAGPCPQQP